MTWERASLLPKALIDEFEGGNVVKEEVITDHCYGVVNHTLVVKSSATESNNPPAKKVKRAPLPSDPGFVCHNKLFMLKFPRYL